MIRTHILFRRPTTITASVLFAVLCLLVGVLRMGPRDRVVCNLTKLQGPGTIPAEAFTPPEGPFRELVYSIHVQDNYLYAGTNSSFRIFDVTDPATPRPVSIIPLATDSSAVIGHYVYLSGREFRIFDISNPKVPVEVSCDPNSLAEFWEATVVDGYAYIPRGQDGLQILDVSDPETLVEVSRYSSRTRPRLLWLPGYLRPLPIEFVESQPRLVIDIVVQDDHAFVAEGLPGIDSIGDGRITVLDVSNPHRPRVVNAYQMSTGVSTLHVSGNYLVATSSYMDSPDAVIVDISEPTTTLETVTAITQPGLVAYRDEYALFITALSGVEVWDFSDPKRLVQHDWDEWIYRYTIAFTSSGNYAYFATQYGGFHVVDISDPFNPVTVSVSYE